MRTKASTYIRSIQPSHRRLALKCWQGHFESANDRERMILTKFMVRFNGKFPAWQGKLLNYMHKFDAID